MSVCKHWFRGGHYCECQCLIYTGGEKQRAVHPLGNPAELSRDLTLFGSKGAAIS